MRTADKIGHIIAEALIENPALLRDLKTGREAQPDPDKLRANLESLSEKLHMRNTLHVILEYRDEVEAAILARATVRQIYHAFVDAGMVDTGYTNFATTLRRFKRHYMKVAIFEDAEKPQGRSNPVPATTAPRTSQPAPARKRGSSSGNAWARLAKPTAKEILERKVSQ